MITVTRSLIDIQSLNKYINQSLISQVQTAFGKVLFASLFEHMNSFLFY